MKRIVLTLCVFIALATFANAGEMYRCVDRDGNTIISDYQRDGMKCSLKGYYRDPSPQERAQEQEESQRIRVQQENQEAQRIQEEEKQQKIAEEEKQQNKMEELK
jgi:hypothetical protein